MEKTAIFVDVQNIYYTVKEKYNCHFDYNTFWNRTTSNRELVTAIAYATNKGDQKQIHFQEILRRIGFDIKLKPFTRRKDGSAKGDWDTGIVLDMVNYADKVDTIVLASGDGDFSTIIDHVTEKHHISAEIYGVPGLTALSLINSASTYVPIKGDLLLPIPKSW